MQKSDENRDIITWKKFAWATFYYKAIAGDDAYQKVIEDNSVIEIRKNPFSDLIKQAISEIISFLNKWGTMISISGKAAEELEIKIVEIGDELRSIEFANIKNVDFNSTFNIKGTDKSISEAVQKMYDTIDEAYDIGPTATSKILHVLQPNLFAMWDEPIRHRFLKENKKRENGEGYCAFLRHGQKDAKLVISEFEKRPLSPQRKENDTPEEYLKEKLGCCFQKSFAKYLDEYYWIRDTRKIELPPNWYPDKKA